tara:strand:+ start:2788 stop:3480 length:693 start_codon:yes stop_codon:yes gene_type:complete
MFNFKKALCFFSHPDDETLGAGGTIKKMTDLGIEVHVAISNTGIHSRRNKFSEEVRFESAKKLKSDCLNALAHLNIKKNHVYFGNFSDNEIDKHTLLELVHWLEMIMDKINPEAIFTHHKFCTNIDHRYCHEAAIVASRPTESRHIQIFSCEIPSSTGYLKPASWEPNYYVEISIDQLESKIKSMQTFEIEARKDPHPRSPEVLRALAKVRGSESGFSYAESFIINQIFS